MRRLAIAASLFAFWFVPSLHCAACRDANDVITPEQICAGIDDSGWKVGLLWPMDKPTVRYASTLRYDAFVRPGLYLVSLHFTEPNATGAGQRLIDVKINDNLVIRGLDLYAAVGVGVPTRRGVIVAVLDSPLRIEITSTTARPAVISGLRIADLGVFF